VATSGTNSEKFFLFSFLPMVVCNSDRDWEEKNFKKKSQGGPWGGEAAHY
jgi:hypothetical protein